MNIPQKPQLHKHIVSGSHLDKCLKAIAKFKRADILIDYYEKHHILRLSGAKIEECIVCTTKQAERLIPFAKETELVPTIGYRYHFYDYR